MIIFDRDHAGGNEKIKQLVPGIKVYGGSIDNVKGCTNKLENGDRLTLGADVKILSLHTPWFIQIFTLSSLFLVFGLNSIVVASHGCEVQAWL